MPGFHWEAQSFVQCGGDRGEKMLSGRYQGADEWSDIQWSVENIPTEFVKWASAYYQLSGPCHASCMYCN